MVDQLVVLHPLSKGKTIQLILIHQYDQLVLFRFNLQVMNHTIDCAVLIYFCYYIQAEFLQHASHGVPLRIRLFGQYQYIDLTESGNITKIK